MDPASEQKTSREGRPIRTPKKILTAAMMGLVLLSIAVPILSQTKKSYTRTWPPSTKLQQPEQVKEHGTSHPRIVRITKLYIMEHLGTTYKGITMDHLIFSIDMLELSRLIWKVVEWCTKIDQFEKLMERPKKRAKEDVRTTAWKNKHLPKVKSAFNKCKGTRLRMEREDDRIRDFLGPEPTLRSKRFFATMGAFAIGGALTLAAEEVPHLLQRGGSYDNEHVLAKHIQNIERRVKVFNDDEAHFNKAIIKNNDLIAATDADERLDAFLIRIDQILNKLVEDHRDLKNRIEDLFVHFLHVSLIPLPTIGKAMAEMNGQAWNGGDNASTHREQTRRVGPPQNPHSHSVQGTFLANLGGCEGNTGS
ncbi:uncharacterized protein LOC131876863 [Tigriopus californicus]|uniref:uncharacterized protein LOC131876863 n=1 Tax=Tigriopus californicus TaxID=6832 RepID=UPI0027DA9879|nr:uncharacterized protein LOC131876863 [Tigriopus californicus]